MIKTKFLTFLLATCLTFSTISLANAEAKKFAGVGFWEAFGGDLNDGSLVCGVGTTFKDGRSFSIKHFDQNDHFEVVAASPSWKVPTNVNVTVAYQIDNGTIFRAKVGKDVNSDHSIFWFINSETASQFEKEFRNGSVLRIEFSGNDNGWSVSLDGSDTIMDAFAKCLSEKQKALTNN